MPFNCQTNKAKQHPSTLSASTSTRSQNLGGARYVYVAREPASKQGNDGGKEEGKMVGVKDWEKKAEKEEVVAAAGGEGGGVDDELRRRREN